MWFECDEAETFELDEEDEDVLSRQFDLLENEDSDVEDDDATFNKNIH